MNEPQLDEEDQFEDSNFEGCALEIIAFVIVFGLLYNIMHLLVWFVR